MNDYLNFIKRDAIYIILIIFALAACIYTLTTVDKAIDKVNENWKRQLIKYNCVCSSQPANYSLLNGRWFLNETKDTHKNT